MTTHPSLNPNGVLVLQSGREKPLLKRHPWIFSGAIDHVEGSPAPGDAVYVTTQKGEFVGIAYWNPSSQITGRMLTWEDQSLDDDFWVEAIGRAAKRREWLNLEPQTNGYRLINAESDGLPGLIVDKYDQFLVMQCLTKGIDVRKTALVDYLAQLLKPTAIIERSDVGVRKKEGLSQEMGVVYGSAPDDEVWFQENGLAFQVDLMKGHKTGFYLDQRENRQLLGQASIVAGKRVLNCFSYTGGFSVYAAAAGAQEVISVDASIPALELAEINVAKNAPDRPDDSFLAGNVFDILNYYRDTQEEFDVIVLDPPKFAHSAKDVQKASRGYKNINLLAMGLLRPGGHLFTFSCSGQITTDLFNKIVFGAAIDAGREAIVLKQLNQSADHTRSLHFPEGHYLKGLMLEIQ